MEMKMVFAYKGSQVWNDEMTEGYEFTRDVYAHETLQAEQLRELGNAPKPESNKEAPRWFPKFTNWQFFKAYMSKHPEFDGGNMFHNENVYLKPVIKENSHVQDQNDQG